MIREKGRGNTLIHERGFAAMLSEILVAETGHSVTRVPTSVMVDSAGVEKW